MTTVERGDLNSKKSGISIKALVLSPIFMVTFFLMISPVGFSLFSFTSGKD